MALFGLATWSTPPSGSSASRSREAAAVTPNDLPELGSWAQAEITSVFALQLMVNLLPRGSGPALDGVFVSLDERVRASVRAHLPPGAHAWVVGTLAWGNFGPQSDVDLVLDGVASWLATEIETATARAANAPVDLLMLAELPADFRDRVLSEGVALHDDQ